MQENTSLNLLLTFPHAQEYADLLRLSDMPSGGSSRVVSVVSLRRDDVVPVVCLHSQVFVL